MTVTTQRHDERAPAADVSNGARLIDGASFILQAPRETPAVWGEGEQVAWPQDESLLLVGPTGVGKTTLAQQLIKARLGIGPSTVLGLPVAREERRVLYLACDRPAQVARSFARMVGEEQAGVLEKRLLVWRGPPPADFAKHPAILAELCRDADAGTVCIDSLKDVALKLSDDETGAGLNMAIQRAIVEGVQVLGLHHQRKPGSGGGKPNTLGDVYGSAWITAGAGSVILLWGNAGDPVVELAHLKPAVGEVGPFKVAHDQHSGQSSILNPVDPLALVEAQPGITAVEVARMLFDVTSPSPAQRMKAARRLDSLVRAGAVRRQDGVAGGKGGGEPTRYYPVALLDPAA